MTGHETAALVAACGLLFAVVVLAFLVAERVQSRRRERRNRARYLERALTYRGYRWWL